MYLKENHRLILCFRCCTNQNADVDLHRPSLGGLCGPSVPVGLQRSSQQFSLTNVPLLGEESALCVTRDFRSYIVQALLEQAFGYKNMAV